MAAAATLQSPVPYGSTNDCSSTGFCTIYCHRWCNVFSTPPPPVEFDDESSGPTLSPIVIAVIGILASAFLLFSYYVIVSRFYGALESSRHQLHGPLGEDGREHDGGNNGRLRPDEAWQEAPSSDGLDEVLINKIAVYKYRRGEGVVEETDCSVCLNEFGDDESLRLLPRCSHAFHLHCIDTWLKSHSNCPLCRAKISWPNWTPPPPQLPSSPEAVNRALDACEGRRDDEVVVFIDALAVGGEEEDRRHLSCRGGAEDGSAVYVGEVETVRRTFSLDSDRCCVSTADVLLRTNTEDELTAAGPSRREHDKESSKSRDPLLPKEGERDRTKYRKTRKGKTAAALCYGIMMITRIGLGLDP